MSAADTVVGAALRSFDSQSLRDSGSATGYWIHGGFRRQALKVFEWGIDVRHSNGEITLGGSDVEAGGTSISFYMGGNW